MYLSGLVVKNNLSVYTDGSFWMKSEHNTTTYAIKELSLQQSHRCERDPRFIATLVKNDDMRLFVPPVWGAPMTEANHIPGYKTQTNFPWKQYPIELQFGVVRFQVSELGLGWHLRMLLRGILDIPSGYATFGSPWKQEQDIFGCWGLSGGDGSWQPWSTKLEC